MSLCTHMRSNPFSTLTKAKTRSKSKWSWTCTLESWCAWPPTHTWSSEGHYASVCRWFSHTQEYHAHVSRRVGWRSRTNAPVATKARFVFRKISPWCACTPSWPTKLGIKPPPSPPQACQRVGLTTINQVSVMSFMAFPSHWAHVHCNVTSCQVEVQVSIEWCNSHAVDEESWG